MIVAKLSAVSLLLASVGAAERVPRTAGAKDTTRLSVAVRDDKPDQGGYRFEVTNQGRDLIYEVTIQVGTPPQNVTLHLNSDDSEISVRPGQYGSSSTTRRNVSAPEGIDKNSSTNTTYASDQLTVGNVTVDTVLAVDEGKHGKGNSFGFACTYGPGWSPQSFWGKAAAGWTDKQLGVFFSRHKDLSSAPSKGSFSDSEIIAGGVNRSKINGEITYYPFTPDKNGSWVVPLRSLSINGTMVDLGKAARNSTAGNSTAANNSNATLPFGGGTAIQARIVTRSGDRGLRLPGQAVNATLQNVPGAKYILGKGWVLPCNALDNVDIRLNVGGNEYPINGQDLMDDNAHNIQTAEGKLPSSEYCTVGLYEATSNTSYSIGPAFLTNVYTAFRFDPPAVGFAQLASNAQPKPKPKSWAAPALSEYLPFGVAGVAAAAMLVVL